ncbi:MAG: acetyl-CoA carboxylase biotin carboxyl carrier protein [Rhodospirillales bacterium]|nr:acetyl-CoA carboxylase biotin carboxyl carrier protein [Rhodospirillales bacterium]
MAKEPKSGLRVDEDLIRQLAGLLDETGLGEIEVQEGDSKIRVAKGGVSYAAHSMQSAPVAVVPAAPVIEDAASHPGAVTSPMVGVCYLSPDPKSDVFFNEGDSVKEADTLLLIEAMKVFNPISAPRSGTIKKILVKDGTPVEFGEPLVIIE